MLVLKARYESLLATNLENKLMLTRPVSVEERYRSIWESHVFVCDGIVTVGDCVAGHPLKIVTPTARSNRLYDMLRTQVRQQVLISVQCEWQPHPCEEIRSGKDGHMMGDQDLLQAASPPPPSCVLTT